MVLMVAQPFKYTYVLNRILKNSESGKLCAFYYVDILFFCIFPSSLTWENQLVEFYENTFAILMESTLTVSITLGRTDILTTLSLSIQEHRLPLHFFSQGL